MSQLLRAAYGQPGRQQHRVIVVSHRVCVERLREQGISGVEVKPSTLWWVRGPHALSAAKPVCDRYGIWDVLWSMHSSFSELREFVAWIQPKSVLPICASFCSEGAVTESCGSLFGDLLCEPASGGGDAEDAAAVDAAAVDAATTAREVRAVFIAPMRIVRCSACWTHSWSQPALCQCWLSQPAAAETPKTRPLSTRPLSTRPRRPGR